MENDRLERRLKTACAVQRRRPLDRPLPTWENIKAEPQPQQPRSPRVQPQHVRIAAQHATLAAAALLMIALLLDGRSLSHWDAQLARLQSTPTATPAVAPQQSLPAIHSRPAIDIDPQYIAEHPPAPIPDQAVGSLPPLPSEAADAPSRSIPHAPHRVAEQPPQHIRRLGFSTRP